MMNKLDQPRKTTLNINDELLQAAKERAESEGVTLSEWIARAVVYQVINYWKIEAGMFVVPEEARKFAEATWGDNPCRFTPETREASTQQ